MASEPAQDSSVDGPTVPYMSFQGFMNLLDRLRRDGVPQVFDRSWFGANQSGSLTAQIRGTLRFFDLVDEERRPTTRLHDLVVADEPARIEMLRKIAEDKYADAVQLGTDATQGQLADTFRARGLNGGSVAKAITFYCGFADYVSLPVSPFFKSGRPSGAARNGSNPRRLARGRRSSSSQKPPRPPADQPAVPPLEAKKSDYIDLLMKLAEGSSEKDEVRKDLLDRLERALGYTSTTDHDGRH